MRRFSVQLELIGTDVPAELTLRRILKLCGQGGLRCVDVRELFDNEPGRKPKECNMSTNSATQAIAIRPADAFLPIMSAGQAIERRRAMVEMTKSIMKPGVDFGAIPGTGTKPVLLKAGAEKLCSFFGLSVRFELMPDFIGDFTGEKSGGEPLFYYRYKCSLFRGDALVAEGEGSCNSRETKYRYRKSERTCPKCGAAAIIKSKQDRGGFYCFPKKGGCGANFDAADPAITEQQTGRVANPDVAELTNTIGKMAQKRALVAAVLVATNASEFFAVNQDDLPEPENQIDEDALRVDGNGEPDLAHLPTFQATWAAEMQARGFTPEQSQKVLTDSLAKSKLPIERAGLQWRNGAIDAVRAGRFDRLLPAKAAGETTAQSQQDNFPGDEPAPVAAQTVQPNIADWGEFLNAAMDLAAAKGVSEKQFIAGLDLALIACGKKGKGPKTTIVWRQQLLEAITAGTFYFGTGTTNQVQQALTGEA